MACRGHLEGLPSDELVSAEVVSEEVTGGVDLGQLVSPLSVDVVGGCGVFHVARSSNDRLRVQPADHADACRGLCEQGHVGAVPAKDVATCVRLERGEAHLYLVVGPGPLGLGCLAAVLVHVPVDVPGLLAFVFAVETLVEGVSVGFGAIEDHAGVFAPLGAAQVEQLEVLLVCFCEQDLWDGFSPVLDYAPVRVQAGICGNLETVHVEGWCAWGGVSGVESEAEGFGPRLRGIK